LKGLKFVPNVSHSRVFWIKRHANLLSFGVSFANKSIVVGQRSKKDMLIALILVQTPKK
jgi:hypothetical protein